MCGICGVIDYNGNYANERLLRNMCAELQHRGPDDEGIFLNRNTPLAGFGHRRLSILDLSLSGRQPMSNEDGSIWMVLNGEIYNFQELRKELENRGHRFKSHTDAEVVLHLYEDFSEGCLSYLRGMFAFAIWDEKQKKLFLARDRVGKKPLLYHYDGRIFCFASEFSAILASGLVDKNINYEAMDQYLTFGYVPAPATIYKQVFKMLPAHYGILQNGKLSFKKYWDLDYTHKITIPEEEVSGELIRLLKEAVKLRLASDVPLGVFLSGGIDSGIVTALMSGLSGKVKTFSIGFDNEDFDELKYARSIAERYSTDRHEFVVKPNALEILPLLVAHYGEPYADSSAIPTYYVARQTKQYVSVALNGDGGDESFSGYERYQAMALAEAYNRLPKLFSEALRKTIVRLMPDALNFKNKRRRLRRFFENVSLPFYPRYYRWVCMINDDDKGSLYSENFQGQLNNKNPANWLKDYPGLSDNMQLLDRLMAIDIKTNLPNDLLVKMDIASMANSLETRSPFLDHKVMEFAASLPVEYKIRRFTKKYILKKIAENLIPKENIYRKKMGFGMPVGDWLRGELKTLLCDTLLAGPSLKRGYFKPQAVKYMVEQHIDKKKDYSFGLWTLLMLELWHREFID